MLLDTDFTEFKLKDQKYDFTSNEFCDTEELLHASSKKHFFPLFILLIFVTGVLNMQPVDVLCAVSLHFL
jgi:hypothetical protein